MKQEESFLKPEQRNSVFLKKELLAQLYYRLHYSVAIDEFRFMDIFGVKRIYVYGGRER